MAIRWKFKVLAATSLITALGAAAPVARPTFAQERPAVRAPMTLGQIAALAARATPGVFKSTMIPAHNSDITRRWRAVDARMGSQYRTLERCLGDASACPSATVVAWREMVRAIKGAEPGLVLEAVNAFFNGIPYRTDHEVYGVAEKWTTMFEFLAAGGDCEEFAMAKFYTLKILGYDERALHIVVVRNEILNQYHVVLSVEQGRKFMILDSAGRGVHQDARYGFYTPLVSMNQSGAWAHVSAARTDHAVVPLGY